MHLILIICFLILNIPTYESFQEQNEASSKIDIERDCALMGLSIESCEEILKLNFQGADEAPRLMKEKSHYDMNCPIKIENFWKKEYKVSFEVSVKEGLQMLNVSLFTDSQLLSVFHCLSVDTPCQLALADAIDDARRFLLKRLVYDLQMYLECHGIDLETLEGGSWTFAKKIHLLWNLAKGPEVETICEIGFNAGHSSLIWLLSNLNAKLIAFDLGQHSYIPHAANFMSRLFPGRFLLITGDSTITVPSFHSIFPEVKCNILFIDGGHQYEIAKADIENFRSLANTTSHVLIVDDVEQGFPTEAGQPWSEKIRKKDIKQTNWLDDIFSSCFRVPFHILEELNDDLQYHALVSLSEEWKPNAPFETCGASFERPDWYASIATGHYIFEKVNL